MEIKFTKQFKKEISKITDARLAEAVNDAIESVKSAKGILFVPSIKKLKFHKNSYRIKVGDYRIGIYVNGNVAEFARFLHRKEIYRYFP